jgi:very-short-patch-repair endonuclease
MNDNQQRGFDRETPARARRLRREATAAEKKLWRRLRNEQIPGFKFRRQQPIGRFIVDFFCPDAKMIVEIDGDTHAGQEAYDASRTGWLTKQGYRVIRFVNADVLHHLDTVLETIFEECRKKKQYPSP